MGIRDELHHIGRGMEFHDGVRYRENPPKGEPNEHPATGRDMNEVNSDMRGTRGLYDQYKRGR